MHCDHIVTLALVVVAINLFSSGLCVTVPSCNDSFCVDGPTEKHLMHKVAAYFIFTATLRFPTASVCLPTWLQVA